MSSEAPTRHRILIFLLLTLGLAATLALHEYSSLDFRIQDRLFDPVEQRWVVNHRDAPARLAFYTLPKAGVITFALTAAGWLIARRLLRAPPTAWDTSAFRMVLAMALIPAAAGLWKHTSGVFCPSELLRYGGARAYRCLCAPRPAGGAIGHCFPAGHASAGFALMAVSFLPVRPAWRRTALAAGLALGWIMGTYQMLKGAHFLTHTLATMFVAGIIITLLRPGPIATPHRHRGDASGRGVRP